MTNNLKKNKYTAVLGSESGPGLDLGSRSRVCKKWPDQTWTELWTVYHYGTTSTTTVDHNDYEVRMNSATHHYQCQAVHQPPCQQCFQRQPHHLHCIKGPNYSVPSWAIGILFLFCFLYLNFCFLSKTVL